MENCNQHKELPKYYCGTCLDIAENIAIKKRTKKIFEELDAWYKKWKGNFGYLNLDHESYNKIKAKFLQEEAKQK